MNDALRQLLTDEPTVDDGTIEAALKAGLTHADVEWNQRLERPWTFKATNAKEETAAREAYFVRNGLSEEDAKVAAASA